MKFLFHPLSTIFSAIIFLAFTPLAISQEAKPWPTVLKGNGYARVIMPRSSTPPFTYTSRTYRFITQQKLSKTEISKLAATAESVASAISRVPLDLSAPPSGPAKPAIYIYPDEKSYIAAGGPIASAGYYSGSDDAVLLRADLFIKTKNPNYQLLTHELVHLNMDSILAYCGAWFTEGNAEYFSSAFFATSSYRFTDMTRSIQTRAKQFYPNETTIKLPSLEQLIQLDFTKWNELNEQLTPEERFSPYLASLLLVHYFYHLDPTGRAKIQTYLISVHHRSKTGNFSLQDQAPLFPKADLKKIQTTITKHWQSRSLNIQFLPTPK